MTAEEIIAGFYSSSGSSLLLGHLDRIHSLIIHALLLLLCNHTYNSVLACFSLFLLLLVYIRSCFLLVVPVAGSLEMPFCRVSSG